MPVADHKPLSHSSGYKVLFQIIKKTQTNKTKPSSCLHIPVLTQLEMKVHPPSCLVWGDAWLKVEQSPAVWEPIPSVPAWPCTTEPQESGHAGVSGCGKGKSGVGTMGIGKAQYLVVEVGPGSCHLPTSACC